MKHNLKTMVLYSSYIFCLFSLISYKMFSFLECGSDFKLWIFFYHRAIGYFIRRNKQMKNGKTNSKKPVRYKILIKQRFQQV